MKRVHNASGRHAACTHWYMSAPAAYESLHEKEQLEKLERAAAEADEPRRIERHAQAESHERTQRLGWAIPYLTAAAIAAALLVLLQWEPVAVAVSSNLIGTTARVLKGLLAMVAVLAISRAVKVYFVE